MTKKTTVTEKRTANVDEQPWTVAFEKRSPEAFEAALAPDVVRLTTPLRKRSDGSFEAIDWDTAIREIAARLAEQKSG